VRPLRRADGPHRQLLHVPRLRHEHRLLLGKTPLESKGPRWGPFSDHPVCTRWIRFARRRPSPAHL
jgi:hypothetical protein